MAPRRGQSLASCAPRRILGEIAEPPRRAGLYKRTSFPASAKVSQSRSISLGACSFLRKRQCLRSPQIRGGAIPNRHGGSHQSQTEARTPGDISDAAPALVPNRGGSLRRKSAPEHGSPPQEEERARARKLRQGFPHGSSEHAGPCELRQAIPAEAQSTPALASSATEAHQKGSGEVQKQIPGEKGRCALTWAERKLRRA